MGEIRRFQKVKQAAVTLTRVLTFKLTSFDSEEGGFVGSVEETAAKAKPFRQTLK